MMIVMVWVELCRPQKNKKTRVLIINVLSKCQQHLKDVNCMSYSY